MNSKEAHAQIKVNKLLEATGWRFFAEGNSPANIQLEPSVTIKTQDLDALGRELRASNLDSDVLKTYLGSLSLLEQAEALASGAVIRHFGPTHLRQRTISVPPFATQQVTVAEIKAEQALVAANRELIARFEKKIQPTLARVWGEDLPVAEITQTANPSIDALSMPKIPNYYVAKV